METPVALIPAPAPAHEGSTMRRFLAERGSIVIKESRPMATVSVTYGAPLEVAAQVLVVVKGAGRTIYVGVKFEQAETDNQIASAAFVDSDEIDELLGALVYLTTSATQMAHDRRDYTEVTYTTRDDVMVGFFQNDLTQRAFVRLGVGSPLMFCSIETIPNIRAAVLQARDYSETRRAAWEG